ncbi:MAG TPA: hypothetical protein VG273_28550 [Bryobacteraceae bacterium]|jgi:predicted nucleic acid-binding protein|nr:hypothetical protein [Bryobacteraceae bacterium]
MVVVADTSPLNYLVLIGEIGILPKLYTRIVIPEAVLNELRHSASPAPVTGFAECLPEWLEVVTVGAADQNSVFLANLDPGEIAAIALAEAHVDTLLLMDETAGRAEAARRGIRSTGTLGILRDAATAGLLDLPTAFQKLQTTTFRLPQPLLIALLEQDARRKQDL